MRVRLKDIANATGFSTNTVSLALRKSPLVAEDTRDAILKAAADLKYRPNEIAKSLVSRETHSIGLVLTNIINPILTQTARLVENALTARGYTTVFATSSNSIELEKKVIEAFCARQVDGILIYPTDHHQIAHVSALADYNIPVVVLAARPPENINAVSLDERLGAYRATRHLIELGHRRIGLVEGISNADNLEKTQGYELALSESGIQSQPGDIVKLEGFSTPFGYEGMNILMQQPDPPTAVFCVTDPLAIGVMEWCREHDLNVPGDISIIGFDNIEFAAYASTPLTTVAYDAHRLAYDAVDRLISIIKSGGTPPAPVHEIIEPEVLVRKSTGKPRT
ncbi:LacI family DNA-binding transcriptional regulator [uncultured Martelella sp.]|uniref:LacI family DNA-binding transcriptional regulator n=1 Tax=uncultured Martelella sp. TaxID=392331 RepID=UPI0029C67ED1|nr:LacI family DNA-binding transcriptional regulator [uncultured Martelella sp.]